jgi:hypothetical protein
VAFSPLANYVGAGEVNANLRRYRMWGGQRNESPRPLISVV